MLTKDGEKECGGSIRACSDPASASEKLSWPFLYICLRPTEGIILSFYIYKKFNSLALKKSYLRIRQDDWYRWQGQCSGSVTFWYRSGSALRTCGSGSCSFRQWLSRCQQKIMFFSSFCLILFEGTFTSFFKDKKVKKSQNRRQGFCLMTEGSGSESGSVPLTYGSGRPKNLRILWIRSTGWQYRKFHTFGYR
jgi:hypothetical protein